MKICVSALIMHFPITEIASRAKNICCSSDCKVNIVHVRCQSGAIKHCDAKNITDFEHKRYRKKLLRVLWIQKRKNSSIRNKLEVHRDGCCPSLLISGSGSRSQREELPLSRSLFFLLKISHSPFALEEKS